MTSRVWRYRVCIEDRPAVLMPAGARILSVGPPRDGTDRLDLWAEVDPDAPKGPRELRIVGTGNPVPADCGPFVGSVTTHGGRFVWHVYEAATP